MPLTGKYLKYDESITFDIFSKIWSKLYEFGWSSIGGTLESEYKVFKGSHNILKGANDESKYFNTWCLGIDSDQKETTVNEILSFGEKISKTDILKLGDKVNLYGTKYIVDIAVGEYYLQSPTNNNSACFTKAKISTSKTDFQEEVLGYRGDGDFPMCKTLEDLTKFVDAIRDYKAEVKEDKSIELKLDTWYVNKSKSQYIYKAKDNNNTGFVDGNFRTGLFCEAIDWIEVTDFKPIYELFEIEIKSRYTNGTVFTSVSTLENRTMFFNIKAVCEKFSDIRQNKINVFVKEINSAVIYKEGKWAEIVSKPEEQSKPQIDDCVFPKDSYVVMLSSPNGTNQWFNSIPQDAVYKLKENSSKKYMKFYKDIRGIKNGWEAGELSNTCNKLKLRLATQEEIEVYEKAGKAVMLKDIKLMKTEIYKGAMNPRTIDGCGKDLMRFLGYKGAEGFDQYEGYDNQYYYIGDDNGIHESPDGLPNNYFDCTQEFLDSEFGKAYRKSTPKQAMETIDENVLLRVAQEKNNPQLILDKRNISKQELETWYEKIPRESLSGCIGQLGFLSDLGCTGLLCSDCAFHTKAKTGFFFNLTSEPQPDTTMKEMEQKDFKIGDWVYDSTSELAIGEVLRITDYNKAYCQWYTKEGVRRVTGTCEAKLRYATADEIDICKSKTVVEKSTKSTESLSDMLSRAKTGDAYTATIYTENVSGVLEIEESYATLWNKSTSLRCEHHNSKKFPEYGRGYATSIKDPYDSITNFVLIPQDYVPIPKIVEKVATITTCKGFNIGDIVETLDTGGNETVHPKHTKSYLKIGEQLTIESFEKFNGFVVALCKGGYVLHFEKYHEKFKKVEKVKTKQLRLEDCKVGKWYTSSGWSTNSVARLSTGRGSFPFDYAGTFEKHSYTDSSWCECSYYTEVPEPAWFKDLGKAKPSKSTTKNWWDDLDEYDDNYVVCITNEGTTIFEDFVYKTNHTNLEEGGFITNTNGKKVGFSDGETGDNFSNFRMATYDEKRLFLQYGGPCSIYSKKSSQITWAELPQPITQKPRVETQIPWESVVAPTITVPKPTVKEVKSTKKRFNFTQEQKDWKIK